MSLKAGRNSWVVDAGSGHNLVPRASLTEEERAGLEKSDKPLLLNTANGTIRVQSQTTTSISALGSRVVARVLDNTPRVLSVQYLVEQLGAEFQ